MPLAPYLALTLNIDCVARIFFLQFEPDKSPKSSWLGPFYHLIYPRLQEEKNSFGLACLDRTRGRGLYPISAWPLGPIQMKIDKEKSSAGFDLTIEISKKIHSHQLTIWNFFGCHLLPRNFEGQQLAEICLAESITKLNMEPWWAKQHNSPVHWAVICLLQPANYTNSFHPYKYRGTYVIFNFGSITTVTTSLADPFKDPIVIIECFVFICLNLDSNPRWLDSKRETFPFFLCINRFLTWT